MEQRDDWHLTDMLHHEHGRGDPFAAAVRATRMPMVITDPGQPDNPIVFANEAFQRLSGYTRAEILGRNCRFLQGPETNRDDVARIREAIEAGHAIDVDLLNYRKDGSTFWNALYLSPVRASDGQVQFFFASQMDVTERVAAKAIIAEQKAIVESMVEARTADLKEALEAKTLLLHEVDHRVKNNLNMIGSLVRLQAHAIADPAVSEKLGAMLERIDALAAVHRRLYQADDITQFDFSAFASNLVGDVVGASGRSDIAIEEVLQPISVPSGQASALGLVLNEIVTNAIKHAFAGRSGRIKLLALSEGGMTRVSIEDDGPGIDVGRSSKPGLGQTLIKRLSKQANATVEFTQLSPGTRVTLHFSGDA